MRFPTRRCRNLTAAAILLNGAGVLGTATFAAGVGETRTRTAEMAGPVGAVDAMRVRADRWTFLSPAIGAALVLQPRVTPDATVDSSAITDRPDVAILETSAELMSSNAALRTGAIDTVELSVSALGPTLAPSLATAPRVVVKPVAIPSGTKRSEAMDSRSRRMSDGPKLPVMKARVAASNGVVAPAWWPFDRADGGR